MNDIVIDEYYHGGIIIVFLLIFIFNSVRWCNIMVHYDDNDDKHNRIKYDNNIVSNQQSKNESKLVSK